MKQEIKFTNYKGDSMTLTCKRKCQIDTELKYYKVTKDDDGIPVSKVEIDVNEFLQCPLAGFAEYKLYIAVYKTERSVLVDNFNQCKEITYNDDNTKYILKFCNIVSLEECGNKYKICFMSDYWMLNNNK